MKPIFAAILATSALATAAQAGGPVQVVEEAPVAVAAAPVPYAGSDWTGGYIGAQIGYGDIASAGTALDGDGALGGVHAGYRYDFGQWVVGGELSYDTTDIALGAGADSLDDVTRLKLSAGYDMGPALLYVAGGAARASVTVGGVGLSDNGWFAGVGLDYALTDQWTLGGEILNHKFDNFAGTGSNIEATTVQARVSFRF